MEIEYVEKSFQFFKMDFCIFIFMASNRKHDLLHARIKDEKGINFAKARQNMDQFQLF
jgi:hypothetical protein